ncbi:Uma2 family endonuclease [Sorangium sp. So ce385]|uniref:Uma2 family endonuclease n=1 Tax=Sorangium sp. So ce385 TaxID=3133308 RepID=UPI003F5C0EFB
MAQAAARTGLSPQEYLAFERSSPLRHEYADGEIFAMAGGTLEHSAVAANVIGELRSALQGRGCRVLTSDMRVKIAATRRYVYPDGAVVCSRPEFEDEQRDTLLNPRLVVEVLSDSSEAYDRGEKFAQYRTLPSLQEYVLASQKAPRIEVFTRQPDGAWLLRIHGPGERAALSSLDCALDVDRVYLDVFEQGATGDGPPAAP